VPHDVPSDSIPRGDSVPYRYFNLRFVRGSLLPPESHVIAGKKIGNNKPCHFTGRPGSVPIAAAVGRAAAEETIAALQTRNGPFPKSE
jgi:hypothetical protein